MSFLRQRLVSIVTRRYPFLSGCGSFANSRMVRFAAGNCAGTGWTKLSNGDAILVPLDDYVGRAAFFVGDLDRKVSRVIKSIVRPGDNVLDIGANLGLVTLPLSRLVSETGVVHAVEPNPSVRDLLLQSVNRNQIHNVKVHPIALSNQEGEMTLSYPVGNAGRGGIDVETVDQGWTKVKVAVRSLSSLASDLHLAGTRLVKIDVEGHEYEVLQGGLEWLRTSPPDVILFESNTSNNMKSQGVLDLLIGVGYRLFSIPKSLFSLRLTPYIPDDNRTGMSHDMVAIFRECQQEVLSRFG